MRYNRPRGRGLGLKRRAKRFTRGALDTVSSGCLNVFSGIRTVSNTTKTLFVLVFAIGVLFVPWGIFQYAGWLLYTLFAYISNYAVDLLVLIASYAVNFVGMLLSWIVNAVIGLFDSAFYALAGLWDGQDTYIHMQGFTFEHIAFNWDMHLDPNCYRPASFDARTLIGWLWDNVLSSLFDRV